MNFLNKMERRFGRYALTFVYRTDLCGRISVVYDNSTGTYLHDTGTGHDPARTGMEDCQLAADSTVYTEYFLYIDHIDVLLLYRNFSGENLGSVPL